ncbi:hypothetical protein JXC34_03450 [Candidatus Woesearchaeota archaeon]|nr:hypothetical protein [Candidatus Woesearchaeota archaeon]
MNVQRMYKEVIITSKVLSFLDSFLNGTLMFSIVYILAYFYRISILFPLAAGLIFFFRSLRIKTKQNKILVLEEKYPDLRERLRTSYDYQDKTNTIINDLHSDIMAIIKKIDVNAFLNTVHIFLKVTIICFLLSSTIYLASVGFDVVGLKKTVFESGFYKMAERTAKNMFELQERDELRDRDFLDTPRLIQVGDRELNLSIDVYSTELDIGSIGESGGSDFGGHYPEEISGVAQEVYEEKIPEEHRDVIKEYFKKINK